MNRYATKLVSIGVLALFVLSVVPIAFAQTDSLIDTDVSVDASVDASGDSNSNDTADVSVESDVTISERDSKAERVRDMMKERRENLRDGRAEIKQRVVEVRTDIKDMRKVFREERRAAQQDIREHHKGLLGLKSNLKNCKGEDCATLQLKFHTGVKVHLDTLLNYADKSFEQLKERISVSGALTLEDKELALARITALEARVDTKKIEIEALSENATREEVRAEINEMRELVHDIRFEQRKLVALLISTKVDVLAEKHSNLELAMQHRIDEISERGGDVSTLVRIRTQFVAQGDKVEADQKLAREAWITAEDRENKMDAWHAAHVAVKDDLKESREILRDFMDEYKNVKSHLSIEAKVLVEANLNDSTAVSEEVNR